VIILKWGQEKRILEVDVDNDKFQWSTFVTTVMSHATHVRGRGEVYTGFWWGNLRERDHLEDPSVGGRIILR